jgi:predicted nucleic acid-binding Zn ribbon protein
VATGRRGGRPEGAYTRGVTAVQTHCDRCGAALVKDAAYCERCGERTRRARRLVRLTLRIELLVVLLIFVVIIGFAVVYSLQKP